MKTLHVILLTAFAAGLAASVPAIGQEENTSATATPASAPPAGPLRTMPHGRYQCALPGDAGGAAFVVDDEESFRIFTASRYESGGESNAGSGTYIMRGTHLTFTRGPRKGEQFERIGDNQLRKLSEDGTRSDLLCTRLGSR